MTGGRLVFSGGWAGNVTVTWWTTSDGIAVEALPIDDPQARWDQWEAAMMWVSHLVRVE